MSVAGIDNRPADLVLGPLLRYSGPDKATLWVETTRRCTVEILGHAEQTFQVEGHHYAVLVVGDLPPASHIPYEVRLDGRLVWPQDDGRPAPAIRTQSETSRLRLIFGSCRIGGPQPTTIAEPWPDDLRKSRIDALWAYSRSLQHGDLEWPDALMLLGDQVYADEVSPATAAFIRARRSVEAPPGDEVANFEEYTQLYRESWAEPDLRWLLASVPSMMIFDDHDFIDDWNISADWVADRRADDWWDDRITGAFMAYWVYQHLGNLSPPELAEERMLSVARAEEDAGPKLREFARMCDRETASVRWAYDRDFGDTRLIVLDSRAARVLGDGRREMIDEEEWAWIVERTEGQFAHLVLASTLPVFMPHGVHELERFSEAVCAGRFGRRLARFGEWLRREVDLDHWPAFNESLARLVELLRRIAGAPDGVPPASVVLLGGDVHNAYVAEVDVEAKHTAWSRIYQITCSPFRNPLPPRERRIVKLTGSRASALVFRLLSRLAGIQPLRATWRFLERPSFHNVVGELELDGRTARVTIRRTIDEGEGVPLLRHLYSKVLVDDSTLDCMPNHVEEEGHVTSA